MPMYAPALSFGLFNRAVAPQGYDSEEERLAVLNGRLPAVAAPPAQDATRDLPLPPPARPAGNPLLSPEDAARIQSMYGSNVSLDNRSPENLRAMLEGLAPFQAPVSMTAGGKLALGIGPDGPYNAVQDIPTPEGMAAMAAMRRGIGEEMQGRAHLIDANTNANTAKNAPVSPAETKLQSALNTGATLQKLGYPPESPEAKLNRQMIGQAQREMAGESGATPPSAVSNLKAQDIGEKFDKATSKGLLESIAGLAPGINHALTLGYANKQPAWMAEDEAKRLGKIADLLPNATPEEQRVLASRLSDYLQGPVDATGKRTGGNNLARKILIGNQKNAKGRMLLQLLEANSL